jgi:hypothetical protein
MRYIQAAFAVPKYSQKQAGISDSDDPCSVPVFELLGKERQHSTARGAQALSTSMYNVLQFEETFDTHAAIEWAQEHADVPVFAICIYLAIIFYVPDLMKDREPWNLRQVRQSIGW